MRAVLADANTLPCAPVAFTIDLLPNGTYTLSDNSEDDNAFPIIRCPIVINGGGAVIERSPAAEVPQFRFFAVEGGDLTLIDLTLQNGNAVGGGSAVLVGGGGMLTAQRVVFQNNRIEAESGFALRGAAVSGFNAVVTIEDSAFIDNFNDGRAANEAANGGAIGLDSSSGLSRVIRTTFRNNWATDAGGAIFIVWSSIDIQDSRFEQNSAGNGGGAIFGYAAGITLTSSRLEDNRAPRGSAILERVMHYRQ